MDSNTRRFDAAALLKGLQRADQRNAAAQDHAFFNGGTLAETNDLR
jgi:hypothetical protein